MSTACYTQSAKEFLALGRDNPRGFQMAIRGLLPRRVRSGGQATALRNTVEERGIQFMARIFRPELRSHRWFGSAQLLPRPALKLPAFSFQLRLLPGER
jgi:hypothetical protein